MFNKKTINDVDVQGKVILLRADYNVPIEYSEDGSAKILNNYRIRSSLPTIKNLIERGAKKIIIISHMGRPKSVEGIADLDELEHLPNGTRKYSLRPVFNNLCKLLQAEGLNFPMNFHTTPIFPRTRYSVSMKDANDDYKIEMLENLRFSKAEKNNLPEFAEALAQVTGADLFVQDGFGVIHREHTSTSEIAKKMPSVAGLLLEKEYSTILQAFKNPERPFVAVMGGAKISDKLPLIEKFIEQADKIIVAGAMVNTFLKYLNVEVGKSRIEDGQNEIIEQIFELAERKVGFNGLRSFIILPEDVAVASEFSKNAERIEKPVTAVLENEIILDLGEKSIQRIENEILNAKMIVWNGTIGYAEFDNFAKGSYQTCSAISKATKNGAKSIVGGGDTSAFVLDWSSQNAESADFSLISTGGGAALELMSGEILPGFEVLENKA
jgi:phosphoglycerate kinase